MVKHQNSLPAYYVEYMYVLPPPYYLTMNSCYIMK